MNLILLDDTQEFYGDDDSGGGAGAAGGVCVKLVLPYRKCIYDMEFWEEEKHFTLGER